MYKKFVLSVLIASSLSACGGGDDSGSADTSTPVIPLEPSITAPTTDCGENGECLEDNFTGNQQEEQLPTLPCPENEQGGESMCEDPFFDLTKYHDIAAMLLEDVTLVTEACKYQACSIGEDGQPLVELTEGLTWKPLENKFYLVINDDLVVPGGDGDYMFKVEGLSTRSKYRYRSNNSIIERIGIEFGEANYGVLHHSLDMDDKGFTFVADYPIVREHLVSASKRLCKFSDSPNMFDTSYEVVTDVRIERTSITEYRDRFQIRNCSESEDILPKYQLLLNVTERYENGEYQ